MLEGRREFQAKNERLHVQHILRLKLRTLISEEKSSNFLEATVSIFQHLYCFTWFIFYEESTKHNYELIVTLHLEK